ncbi:MAG: hypothetical protein ABSH52_28360 [Terriglobia bacterium]
MGEQTFPHVLPTHGKSGGQGHVRIQGHQRDIVERLCDWMKAIKSMGPAANNHDFSEPRLDRNDESRKGFIFTLTHHGLRFVEQGTTPSSKSAVPALSLVPGNWTPPAIVGGGEKGVHYGG